jgi:ubiquinone/menaquinone biosynthesis C-methylase UbiE
MLAKLSRSLPRDARLVGIDIDRTAISRADALVKQARGKAKAELRCVNAENTALDKESFDIIVANLSFSVFSRPRKVASEIVRILKSSGRLIASEVNSLSVLGKVGQIFDNASGHLYYNLFSPSSLTNLFTPYGLRATRIAGVPIRTRIMKRDLRIPARFSPVFLIELSRPSFLY